MSAAGIVLLCLLGLCAGYFARYLPQPNRKTSTHQTQSPENYQRVLDGISDAFASLNIGIAVFDRVDNLLSFNPALCELLNTQPSWLSKKPSLTEFIDRMRLEGKLPEPRDFKSWRDAIGALVSTAKTQAYAEDWHLPDQRILRVNGKPSLRGTVIFSFEDISRSVSVEQGYRLELERLSSILEQSDTAIVVFAESGRLHYANAACEALWAHPFSQSVNAATIEEFTEIMRQKLRPNPDLAEIREFVCETKDRKVWTSKLSDKDEGAYYLRATPLAGGYSMLEFSSYPLLERIAKTDQQPASALGVQDNQLALHEN